MFSTPLEIYSLLVLAGCAQGWLFFLLVDAFQRFGDLPLTFTVFFCAVVGSTPLAVYFTAARGLNREFRRYLAAHALLTAALAVYVGSQLTEESQGMNIFVAFYTTMLGNFAALPFVQSWIGREKEPFEYPKLIQNVWDNTVTTATVGAFTIVSWILLVLWAGLFSIVGVNVIGVLFEDQKFVVLLTPIIIAFGMTLSLAKGGLVASLRDYLLLVFCRLLPAAAVSSLILTAALPFTGVAPLWATGHATFLVVAWQIALLALLNAAFHDGTKEPPYHPLTRRVVDAAIGLLPVFAGLAVYATYLRVGQYGWTVWRVYGALMVMNVGLYSCAYAVAVLKRAGGWMRLMAPVNTAMALLLVAEAVLVNSPILDPRRIDVYSQVRRLDAGADLKRFDFDHLRFDAGKPGIAALEAMAKRKGGVRDEEIAWRARATLSKGNRWDSHPRPQDPKTIAGRIDLYPQGTVLDPTVLDYLAKRHSEGGRSECFRDVRRVPVLAKDLDRDGKPEYILFCGYWTYVVGKEKGSWRTLAASDGPSGYCCKKGDMDKFLGALKKKNYKIVPNRWDGLLLNGTTYYFDPKTYVEP